MKYTGKWTTYKTKHSPTKKGKTSTEEEVDGQGQGLRQAARRSPSTGPPRRGKVKVTVDGKATTLDLYDKAGKALKKTGRSRAR